MAKAKARKSAKFQSTTKRNLFIVAVILIAMGLVAFFMEYKSQKTAEELRNLEQAQEQVSAQEPDALGPDHGCTMQDAGYVCDIKISNPSQNPLEWSAVLSDLDGATVSNNGEGTIEPYSETVVQLTVPALFCANNPEGMGKVTILDTVKSSNQSQAAFDCKAAENS